MINTEGTCCWWNNFPQLNTLGLTQCNCTLTNAFHGRRELRVGPLTFCIITLPHGQPRTIFRGFISTSGVVDAVMQGASGIVPTYLCSEQLVKVALVFLQVYCDYHGHSRRKNIFMYGCSPQLSWMPNDTQNPACTGNKMEDNGFKVGPACSCSSVLTCLCSHFSFFCGGQLQRLLESDG